MPFHENGQEPLNVINAYVQTVRSGVIHDAAIKHDDLVWSLIVFSALMLPETTCLNVMNRSYLRISWILLHGAAVAFVLLNLLTGLRMAIVSHPQLLWLSALLPQGELHSWHLWGGFGLTATSIGYLIYRTLLLTPTTDRRPRPWNRYHRWVIRAGYGVVVAMLISGWLMTFDKAAFGWVADLHFFGALVVVAYLLLHGGGYVIQFGKNVVPRLFKPGKQRPVMNLWIMMVMVALVSGCWLFWQRSKTIELPIRVIAINELINIDGVADEAVWERADAVSVMTHGGANFVDGRSRVSIKALHNGQEAFFHITWEDPDKSLKHLPLKKTKEGWQVQGQGFYGFDEQQFYEDKFAVMLSRYCEAGADGTMHLGPKPLSNKPANWHGKGYHYADDGKMRDLWHWKAVRTNDMYLADDNFIGAPDQVRPGVRRYAAGYMQDSKESGAYVMNWQWYTPSSVVPKRIPKDPQQLEPYQSEGDDLNWVISWFEYEPYNKGNDVYPTGTIMPSVMYRSNRFEGDRADVRAHGIWQDGYWSLELSRKLNTASPYDVAIDSGNCLWVSAFDRSQVAHTRHNRPLRMTLEVRDD